MTDVVQDANLEVNQHGLRRLFQLQAGGHA